MNMCCLASLSFCLSGGTLERSQDIGKVGNYGFCYRCRNIAVMIIILLLGFI